MQAPLDTGFGDIEVRVVRRENHRTVAFDEVLRRAAWQSRIQHDMAPWRRVRPDACRRGVSPSCGPCHAVCCDRTSAASAPGLCPHLHRDCAHICTGTVPPSPCDPLSRLHAELPCASQPCGRRRPCKVPILSGRAILHAHCPWCWRLRAAGQSRTWSAAMYASGSTASSAGYLSPGAECGLVRGSCLRIKQGAYVVHSSASASLNEHG